MHNKKWSNNLKKSLTMIMITAILIPNVVNAASPNEYFKKNSPNLTKLELGKDLKAEMLKIQDGVDTKTNKEVSIIVEFKSEPLVQSKNSSQKMSSQEKIKLDNVNKEHETFKNFLNNKDESTTFSNKPKVEHEYKNTFNGVSMKVKGTDIEKLLESGVVKTIWKDESLKLELPKDTKSSDITPYMSNSKPLIGVDKLH